MDTDDKQELLVAVQLLIRSPNAKELFTMVEDTAALVGRFKLLAFIGDATPLLPLARLKFASPGQYNSIIDLVDRKRHDLDLEPLRQQDEYRFDKGEYMKQFMQQKRYRLRRAADIENAQRPARDRLIGRSRLDFMNTVSARWKDERERLIQKAMDANGGKLSKEQYNTALDTFWSRVDAQLDAAEAKVAGRSNNASLAELSQVLKHDPYKK